MVVSHLVKEGLRCDGEDSCGDNVGVACDAEQGFCWEFLEGSVSCLVSGDSGGLITIRYERCGGRIRCLGFGLRVCQMGRHI